ncbi:PREDICTED: uncharacterized protein LOC104816955 [Tarenaya hassleriana]|uniref:uncharacterized protein LOC104816955 n=1 Tax=Tarenaya hassleriana TaxID=28532 RepID=UPI00053C1B2B|nr:PREDICTED: uncharacterized protein LOC104816955 [Tarenaya hassleriana]
MSPASKSKSKEKKAGKDAQKASMKPTVSINANSSMPANAYNPLLGTFQVLDPVSISSGSPLHNGRFRSIDEADGYGVESDAISNNGSWSGESEDHKEKTSNASVRQEVIPGADNDKREKIRQKNERKHQRQKERRAQELHEKCSTYLMSRKLETLTQQLVAMGISQEHATTALMLNEGKVEESVHWLFDRSEEEVEKQSTQNTGNLKIDIAEELARITDMEMRFKCTRQEVERAVVAAEGDLDQAEEALNAQKHDQYPVPVKQEEPGDPLTSGNGKLPAGITYQNSAAPRPQTKPVPMPALQQARDERDFNYTKSPPMTGGSLQPLNKMVQPLKILDPKLEWAKPQQSAALVDKRWTNTGQIPSASYPLASPSQTSPHTMKVEARYVPKSKNLQQPSNRDPVTMMQRTQVVSAKQIPASSISTSPPGTSTSRHPATGIEIMKSNGFMPPHIPSTRSPSPNNLNPNQIYQQFQYQHQQRFNNMMDPNSTGMARGGNGLWTRNIASPPIVAAASSLGLFSGVGSTGTSGASSPVDWSSGNSVAHLDYTSIDWSLDRGLSLSPKFNGLWPGSTSPLKNNNRLMYDADINGYGLKNSMGVRGNGSGVPMGGLENGNVAMPAETSATNSREWTSPFEGKDIFSLSRQYVSPPL